MRKSNTRLKIIYTTVATQRGAQRLAEQLVAARLAACVQMAPIHSVYRWQGKVESANEILLTIKTRADLTNTLIRWIKRHHPYETPEILACPVTASPTGYRDWVYRETRSVKNV